MLRHSKEAQFKSDKDCAEDLCISQLTSKQQRQQAANELERIAEVDKKANAMETALSSQASRCQGLLAH